MSVFYKAQGLPICSTMLFPTRQEARSVPCGDLALGFCSVCGFISNVAFEAKVQSYTFPREDTQSFSPMFSQFAQRLARDLIARYGLHDKEIIEIGCGQGEFLTLLCELGHNRGRGFDPAYLPRRGPVGAGWSTYGMDAEYGSLAGRGPSEAAGRVSFIADYYSDKYAHYTADLICCKMTLEHIPDVARFVRTVRGAIGDHLDTAVFFQVPDAVRILRELAFWDVYYEHCSYFSLGALGRLFQSCGFEVLDLFRAYGDQYLMLEAKPRQGPVGAGWSTYGMDAEYGSLPRRSGMDAEYGSLPRRSGVDAEYGSLPTWQPAVQVLDRWDDLAQLSHDTAQFGRSCVHRVREWRTRLQDLQKAGRRAVLWGGSSKAVAFLSTLKVGQEVEYVVDVNPHRQGTFVAGSGQQIVAPEFLRDYQPHVVILMNPIYYDEVSQELGRMGLAPDLITV